MNAQLNAGHAARLAIRTGAHRGPTARLAPGFVQVNLAILPAALAPEFLLFCTRNPRPCPLLACSEPGETALPALGRDIDVRTDAPAYRVWRNGELVAEPADLHAHWRDDLVTFAIGCSYSFEEALLAENLPVRHIEHGTAVPMYRTNLPTVRAGRFAGPTVVSMRPMRPAQAIRAVQVTSRFPAVHGAPIHLGFPGAIGIADLHRPDYGDPVPVGADELPVFWACGVTPQAVVAASRPEFCITHAPGQMLVTDLRNSALAAF